jgi:hypothetical protein
VTRSHHALLSSRAFRIGRRITVAALLLSMAAGAAWAEQVSLGEYARKLRSQKKTEVLISREDASELFKSVDEITRFSSEESGLPRLTPVKRKLIGEAEATQHFTIRSKDEARNENRIQESVVVLKKFGMLPAGFDLDATLNETIVNSISGFYDFKNKTMYLLNWIEPEMQESVMAHELTHALQDQNFHLAKFAGRPKSSPEAIQMRMQRKDDSESFLSRRAVVEGQATLVGADYDLRDLGVSLADSPDVRRRAIAYLEGSYSQPVTIHNAPRLMTESMIFPYREGLIFELEVLSKRGRDAAFRKVFRKPPMSTHQILQPKAYLTNEPTPRVFIGDLSRVFGRDYVAYDSGSIGEFDVQIMAEDFGRENDIYLVARKWKGGSYVAVRRAAAPAGKKTKTSDVALVYVSRWKTRRAGERFGKIYLDAIAKRLRAHLSPVQKCRKQQCAGPLWERHASTSEGPVHAELWPGNLLLITQSVESKRIPALRSVVLAPGKAPRRHSAQLELAPRLFAAPEIQALSERMGAAMRRALCEHLSQ